VDIWEAVESGNIEAVKQHLDAGTDVNVKGEYEWTPLHRAVYQGHKEIVELLIANGADVNAKDFTGSTPLHWSISEGHKEAAKLLIANGADVNAKTKRGETPLDFATHPDNANKNKKETADLLRKHGGKTAEELKAEAK
jgi:ankyrin repeat protein